jgi:hypothetical protein
MIANQTQTGIILPLTNQGGLKLFNSAMHLPMRKTDQ